VSLKAYRPDSIRQLTVPSNRLTSLPASYRRNGEFVRIELGVLVLPRQNQAGCPRSSRLPVGVDPGGDGLNGRIDFASGPRVYSRETPKTQ